jgi:2-dehydro-3-deoxyphosphogluconate aldolase/(4S)-4-hydroxy-2-oxoglutarate aldolase
VHWIEQERIFAVVRLDDLGLAVELASALVDGGVRGVEFTYTNPVAGSAIERVRTALGDSCHVGAGTVLDPETARGAILSGAEYLVTPTFNFATITLARRYGVTIVAGALTPTEMQTAWESGADYVKVHPASLGGPAYFRDVLAPLPHLKLVPSGGVNLETAPEFLRAGAVAVSVGGGLVGRGQLDDQALRGVTERARAYVNALAAV